MSKNHRIRINFVTEKIYLLFILIINFLLFYTIWPEWKGASVSEGQDESIHLKPKLRYENTTLIMGHQLKSRLWCNVHKEAKKTSCCRSVV